MLEVRGVLPRDAGCELLFYRIARVFARGLPSKEDAIYTSNLIHTSLHPDLRMMRIRPLTQLGMWFADRPRGGRYHAGCALHTTYYV